MIIKIVLILAAVIPSVLFALGPEHSPTLRFLALAASALFSVIVIFWDGDGLPSKIARITASVIVVVVLLSLVAYYLMVKSFVASFE